MSFKCVLRRLGRDNGSSELRVMHDLGVAVLRRVRPLVHQDHAAKQRDRIFTCFHDHISFLTNILIRSFEMAHNFDRVH